jgi:L-alanine-DL-glutamate epimerase-like enolase superfamily enzyme
MTLSERFIAFLLEVRSDRYLAERGRRVKPPISCGCRYVIADRDSSPWARLSALPVLVESYELERLSARLSYGSERVTTRIRLLGAGTDGLGEDVSPLEGEDDTLHAAGPVLPLAGQWTLGSLCDRLAELDQWPVPPRWDVARRWRNWAFESAALDLALNQAGRPLHAVIGSEPAPVRFVNSLGLGEPPAFDPIRRRLERHPELRFKLDATPGWTVELIDELAATGAVEIIDFKGHYGLETGELPALLAMYERVVAAFPDALLEDAHDLPEVAELLAPEAHRISYDAPIHSVQDIDATPLTPRALNIKPCRVGDLRSLFDVYSACEARGLLIYGGGMGELDVGRGQIQLLASLFHADAPNDVAPSGFNTDTPASDLPASPLPADPARTGFRRRP